MQQVHGAAFRSVTGVAVAAAAVGVGVVLVSWYSLLQSFAEPGGGSELGHGTQPSPGTADRVRFSSGNFNGRGDRVLYYESHSNSKRKGVKTRWRMLALDEMWVKVRSAH